MAKIRVHGLDGFGTKVGILEQKACLLGLKFQNSRSQVSELVGQGFQNKIWMELGRDFQNWEN